MTRQDLLASLAAPFALFAPGAGLVGAEPNGKTVVHPRPGTYQFGTRGGIDVTGVGDVYIEDCTIVGTTSRSIGVT